jgi:predicted RNA-binding protein associated with RNAse of E/G family
MSAPSTEFLLAVLRVEHARTKMWLADIDALGIALRGGLITPAQAAEHMREMDLLSSPLAKQAEQK